jgi:YfiH family protein
MERNIFFGDAKSCPVNQRSRVFLDWCENFVTSYNLDHLVLPHQTRGTDGLCITSKQDLPNKLSIFECDGDYIITTVPRVGIGVLTADCLPLVVHDPKTDVLAVIHAGWQGTVGGITEKVVTILTQAFQVDPANLDVFFGPSAKNCCYEVQPDFLQHLNACPFKDVVVEVRNGTLFFDVPKYNRIVLESMGVRPENIDDSNNFCTMCDMRFHSYRRAMDKKQYITQATVAWACPPKLR